MDRKEKKTLFIFGLQKNQKGGEIRGGRIKKVK